MNEKKYYLIDFHYFDFDKDGMSTEKVLLKSDYIPSKNDENFVYLNYCEAIIEPKNFIIGPRWFIFKKPDFNNKNKMPLKFRKKDLERDELKGCDDDETAKLIFECS